MVLYQVNAGLVFWMEEDTTIESVSSGTLQQLQMSGGDARKGFLKGKPVASARAPRKH
jgi:hypothetical protein